MHVNQVRLKREEPIEKTDGHECYELQLALCGGKTEADVIEEVSFQGSLEKIIQTAEGWIDDRTEGYPKSAVHALLLNAFMYRDFDSTRCTEVLIYSNRIEICYQGTFGNDYTAACEATKSGITLTLQMNQTGVVSMLSGGRVKSTLFAGVDLNKNEKILMAYVNKHGVISNAEARALVHVGTTATRNLLNGLADKGYLRAEGANRGRKYFLSEGLSTK